MFIDACAQINVSENVFVCVSAFVMKTASNLFIGWSRTVIEGCDQAVCLTD